MHRERKRWFSGEQEPQSMAQVKAVFGTIDALLTTIFWDVGPSSQCKKEGLREDKFCGYGEPPVQVR